MNKNIFFSFLLISISSSAQIQIGSDLNGLMSGDESGTSISLSSDGNILAIGSPYNDTNGDNSGLVQVFSFVDNNWTLLGNNILGLNEDDNFGTSVKLSSDGNILAVGAPNFDGPGNDVGQVRIFSLINNVWTQLGNEINGIPNNNFLGSSVSLSADGNIISIGAPGYFLNSNQCGQVKIYNLVSENWIQLGNTIDGSSDSVFFGNVVVLSSDGSKVAVSDFNYEQDVNKTGKVKIYSLNAGNWIQIGNTISGQLSEDNLRRFLSFDNSGTILAIGIAGNDDNGINSGKVKIYTFSSGNWVLYGNEINGNTTQALFGFSVNLTSDGNSIIISSPGLENNSGRLFIYNYTLGNWNQVNSNIIGEAENDLFGISTTISTNNIFAIGATNNDGNGANSGSVRVYSIDALLSATKTELNEIEIYPNPAKNQLYIINNQNVNLLEANVYSLSGQLLKAELSNNSNTINLENFINGMYILELKTDNKTLIKKIIIEQ